MSIFDIESDYYNQLRVNRLGCDVKSLIVIKLLLQRLELQKIDCDNDAP
jgi:hypothetical protein